MIKNNQYSSMRHCFLLMLLFCFFLLSIPTVAISQIMTFEDGSEGQKIESTIPGMEFTTTAGYDWVYAHKQYYNVYPNGSYYCNGNYFAWLGPNQGYGRIDFEEGTVSNVKTGYSSYSTVSIEAFDAEGNLLDRATGGGNTGTYRLDYLTVDAPNIAYLMVHDSGNYWLIDDLEVTPEDVEIISIDIMEDNNETAHHTDNFDDPFVIRRGQTMSSASQDARFNIAVTVSGNYDPEYYDLSFEAKLKTWSGSVTKKTNLIPSEPTDIDKNKWGARRTEIVEFGDNTGDYKIVYFQINIPYNAPVGRYEFKAFLTPDNNDNRLDEEDFGKPVIVVFNPWCPDDEVGHTGLSISEKKEYVTEKNGIVFKRKDWDPDTISLPWAYDQYNKDVLNYVLDTLGNSSVDDLKSSGIVGRELTRSLRDITIYGYWANDPAGYAESEGYGDDWNGPSYWSKHTAKVFSKYRYTYLKSKPVLFGQCFTYGGLVTSMFRSLGIPCRPVTSFDIKDWHDPTRTWNFHVWNEAWLERSDRSNYNGWQVFDGTYRIGPAPVGAIADNAGGNYDVSEINHVGSAIYTKQIGSDIPVDILDSYGGPQMAFALPIPSVNDGEPLPWINRMINFAMNEVRTFFISKIAFADADDIQIDLGNPVTVNAGESLSWVVRVTNTTSEEITVTANADVNAVVYNGNDLGIIVSQQTDLTIGPGEMTSFTVTISEDSYLSYLSFTNLFKLYVTLESEDEQWQAIGKGAIDHPSLNVELDPEEVIDLLENVIVSWRFTNPLSTSLTNIGVEINGIEEFDIVTGESLVIIDSLEPGGTITGTLNVQAKIPGQHPISVFLHCNELEMLIASAKILVATPPQLSGFVSGPDRATVGTPINLDVNVNNSGDYAGSGTVTVYTPADMTLQSDETQNLGEIAAGENNSAAFTMGSSKEGSYAIPFIVEDSSGNVGHLIHYLTVYSYPHSLNITANVDNVNGMVDSTVILTISNDGGQTDSVELHTYGSTTALDFELFDGVTRIVGQPVSVPAYGTKQLQLHIKGTGYAGEIIATASSLLDPDAADRTTITVVGEETPSSPENFEANLENGNILLTWQPSPEQSVASYTVYRKGPGEYAFTEYATSPCCSFEDVNVGTSGNYSYRLRAVTTYGLESEDTNTVTINIQDKIPGDLDGDGDVDRDDLNIILSHRNQPASVCPECDLDGDGMITALDARKLVLLCTRPRCACEEPPD